MSAPASKGRLPAGLRRHRRALLVAVAAVAVAAVAAGGYGLWYILIGPSSPAAVNAAAPVIPAGASVPAPASLDGTWNVDTSLGTIDDGTASFAGYRVREQLVGVGGHTAVGRTPKISGSMTLAGTTVSNVDITADLTALASDQAQRDSVLTNQAIQTNTFPTAEFKLTSPIDLGTLPPDGTAIGVNATGQLTLHGVTRTVTIALQAVRQGGIIAVTGTLPIVFADYSIQPPSSAAVLTVEDNGIMEVHLLFTHA